MDRSGLTEGSIIGKLTQFFLPILFGMLFQQLYNTVEYGGNTIISYRSQQAPRPISAFPI